MPDKKTQKKTKKEEEKKEPDPPTNAEIMLELPGQVIEISTKLSELESTLEQLVRILTLQTTGLEKVAEINGLLVQLEAKDALSRVQVANSTEAARASMESRPDIGGMYQ